MVRASLFLLILLSLGACKRQPSPHFNVEIQADAIPFRIDGTLDFIREGELLLSLEIEIADNDSSRQRGMMQRDSFPDQTGMLFVWQFEEIKSFWMANTSQSLDLLFVNSDSVIIDIHKYARPFSSENITSSNPAQFVIEVPAGFVDSHGIIESDQIAWRRFSSLNTR